MNPDFKLYLYNERSKSLADHAVARLIGQSGHCVLTFILLWMMAPSNLLIIWLLIALAASGTMFFLTRTLVPDNKVFTIERWRITNMTCSFTIGFCWGMAPAVFFIPGDLLFFVFMISFYSGYIASSLVVSSVYRYSFIVFALGTTIPFAIRLIYEGGFDNNVVAGLMFFFISMMIAVSTNMHKQFLKSVATQYENERLIEQLDQEKTIAQKAVASKDKFLAAASHDLRQPLNAIGLFSEALTPLQTSSKGKEIINKVRQSLNGLNGMLHALLDISRLDSDTVESHPKHVFLKTLINQVYEEYRHNQKKITIRTELTDELIVFADPTLLYRILNNLLDNAVKYTNAGEIVINSEEIDESHILIKITDSGIGIPKDKMAVIFDEFHQLNNPERDRDKGLGLGLAIVKRLCSIANIKLSIESVVNSGTTVTLEVLRGTDQVRHEINSVEHQVSLKGKYILVIDDEQYILEGMQYLLTSYGSDVVTAESLASALQVLQKQPSKVPDLIISDLRLRDELTGIDAINTLRDEYNRDIPALLITGDTAPDRIIKAQEYPTLYKPIDTKELKLKLNELLYH